GDGANAVHVAAGINWVAAVLKIGSISGTSSSDTLNLDQVGNTVVDLGTGSDTLNLTAQSVGVTLIYADNYGADTLSGFNAANGDLIDLTGVSSISTFADVQSRATVVGGNTIIDFGGGYT